jgi:hypothetical protein
MNLKRICNLSLKKELPFLQRFLMSLFLLNNTYVLDYTEEF